MTTAERTARRRVYAYGRECEACLRYAAANPATATDFLARAAYFSRLAFRSATQWSQP